MMWRLVFESYFLELLGYGYGIVYYRFHGLVIQWQDFRVTMSDVCDLSCSTVSVHQWDHNRPSLVVASKQLYNPRAHFLCRLES